MAKLIKKWPEFIFCLENNIEFLNISILPLSFRKISIFLRF